MNKNETGFVKKFGSKNCYKVHKRTKHKIHFQHYEIITLSQFLIFESLRTLVLPVSMRFRIPKRKFVVLRGRGEGEGGESNLQISNSKYGKTYSTFKARSFIYENH